MANSVVNALASASSTKLNLTQQDKADIRKDFSTLLNDTNTIDADLMKLLDNTTLKKVCCLNKDHTQTVDAIVRLPIQASTSTGFDDIDTVRKKIQYSDYKISVPLSLCSTLVDGTNEEWRNGTTKCDAFFNTYCKNAYREFEKSGLKTENEWNAFKPECACYGDYEKSDIEKKLREELVLPTKCFADKCRTSVDVYLDPVSRTEPCPSTTLCQSTIHNIIGSVGNTANITNTQNIKCGDKIYKIEPDGAITSVIQPTPQNATTMSQNASSMKNTIIIVVAVVTIVIGLSVIGTISYALFKMKKS